ncbi:short-chain dehydrogenase [Kwoniella heveanensis BCC8398]|uniref:Short-chain dehydrogenase n=1 Tax=Kwoniella heveanensis BCC8398 TaxID=1296120 RepID=A0A1B9GJ95_9TREE|nr:short-chain dehydrogenase [Kwoniella heveanensis BCC8398]
MAINGAHGINGAAGTAPESNKTVDLDGGATAVDQAVVGGLKEEKHSSLVSTDTPKLFSLANQGVIVTGGARGLGLCIATSLLEASAAHVYCVDILPNPVEGEWKVAQDVASKFGGNIEYRQLDITDEEAVGRVFSDIYSSCQYSITGFFGAAGIQQMIPAIDYPLKDFRRVMEVNVTGTFITVQAAAREMKERNIPGSIVITASMSGSIANKGLTCLAYNTSKSALLQLCRSAAAEWGAYGIRVNTLSPGYIRTAMTDGLLAQRPDLEKEWLSGSMLHRLSTPDEFRGPVLFLLSKASSFVTGADLLVDGGHTAY